MDGSRPYRRAWRIILRGKSDDASEGAPAPARLHAHTSRLVEPSACDMNADTCLRSRFSAVAPFMDASVIAVIVNAVPTFSAASPPFPMASPVPLRCVCVAVRLCAPSETPAATVGNGFALEWGIFGRELLRASIGCGWAAQKCIGARWDKCLCVLVSVIIGGA